MEVQTRIRNGFAWVEGFVYHPYLGKGFFPLKFLVDTGAHNTTILPGNTITLNIDCSELEKSPIKANGVGGSADVYLLKDAIMGFIDEDTDESILLPMEELHVLPPGDEDQEKLVFTLLGVDLLSHFEFTYTKRIATLKLKTKISSK